VTVGTVLLDAGGVVLDETAHEEAWAEAIARVLEPVVPGYDVERYFRDAAEAVRIFVPRVYRYAIWKHVRPDAARAEALFADALRIQRDLRPPLRLMDGVGEEMRRLAGRFRIGLAGQYGARILDLLADHGLLETLAWRFTQDDFDVTKPDPRFYERIAAAAGVRCEDCVMVGDRIDKDVIPARAVGMRTVRIRLGVHREQEPRLPEEVPDVELPSVVGLAAALERLAGR